MLIQLENIWRKQCSIIQSIVVHVLLVSNYVLLLLLPKSQSKNLHQFDKNVCLASHLPLSILNCSSVDHLINNNNNDSMFSSFSKETKMNEHPKKQKKKKKTRWKHNQAEFVTLQSDIWPFTSNFRFGPCIDAIAFQMCLRFSISSAHSHNRSQPKLLFNYDICLLFHLMCGFSVAHHLTLTTDGNCYRPFETT